MRFFILGQKGKTCHPLMGKIPEDIPGVVTLVLVAGKEGEMIISE